jgi:hypothetical protein
MTEPLEVRVGTPDDWMQLMDLAMAATEENGFLPPAVDKIGQEIWSALNQDRGLCGVIGKPGEQIEGAVLLRVADEWYTNEKVLLEKGIFIHPDYRAAKGGRARILCEYSKGISDALNLPLIIGVLSNLRTEAKVRLYKRQFGEPAGAFFLYGAKTGEWQKKMAAPVSDGETDKTARRFHPEKEVAIRGG